jgi:signal transduction histidine kinase/ActR/RegA family two-component response regulator
VRSTTAATGARARGLRVHLIALVVVAILPISLFAVATVLIERKQQRELTEASLGETAAATLLAVEREVDAAVTTLQALAASPLLTRGNLREFYDEAGAVLPTQRGWRTIILLSSSGEQLVNLRRPFGRPLPPVDVTRGHFRSAAMDRTPTVSDLFVGPVGGEPIVNIVVPVERDGAVRYLLIAGVEPAVFGRALEGQHVRDVAGVFDREYRFIARSRAQEKYVGQPPIGPLLEVMRQHPDAGIGRFESYDAQAVYTTWRRSPIGWTVAVAVPAAAVEAPLRRSILVLGSSVIVLLIAGSAVAGLIARGLSRSINEASAAARRMTRGEPIEGSASRVAEIEALMAALREGSALLRQAETERRAALAHEQQRREQAQAENRAKDEFLAMLGHELRNPLSVISSGLAVLGRPDAADDTAARTCQLMRRQLDHLTKLVGDMLDVARVTSGKIVLARRPLDLGALARSSLQTLTDAGRLGRHAVRVDTESVWVDADETRLEQILANLVENATKFTPAGGAIVVSARAEDRHAVLRVEDTGAGIAPDVLPLIFELFVQADRSLNRGPGGLGLGLAVVKRLTEMHGGTVEAASDGIGHGTAVTLRLPRIAAPAPSLDRVAEPTGAGSRRRRILVVEDNEDAREMLRTMLVLQGHEVHEAADGRTGIELARALNPDTAIIDVGLPEVDGYQVAGTLRTRPDGHPIRLIALTGYGREEDRQRAAAAGFAVHLVKPVDPTRLARALDADDGPRGSES